MTPPKATILCIDNHQHGLLGRKILLEESGYDVLEATRGDEGFNLFLSHPVDAVVLDYQIPGMNGAEVAARMKSINRDVPIMLLSACCPLQKNRLRSVDSFLSKSQPPTTFLSALTEMLGNRPSTFLGSWLESRQPGQQPANEGVSQ